MSISLFISVDLPLYTTKVLSVASFNEIERYFSFENNLFCICAEAVNPITECSFSGFVRSLISLRMVSFSLVSRMEATESMLDITFDAPFPNASALLSSHK